MMGELGTVLEAEFGARCEILKARLDPGPSLHRIRSQAVGKAPLVGTMVGKTEEIKHLSCRIKINLEGLLPNGDRGHSDGHQPVPADRKTPR
jgi:hypothetical protein